LKRLLVVYLRRAQQDLAEIYDYIKKDNPQNALAWLKKMDKSLGRLSAFPNSGVTPKDEYLASLGYRVVILGEYLAFYLVREKRVEIRRVLHGRRRYGFLF